MNNPKQQNVCQSFDPKVINITKMDADYVIW